MRRWFLTAMLSVMPALLPAARLMPGLPQDAGSQAVRVDLSDFNRLYSDNFQVYVEKSASLDDSTLKLLETVHDRYCSLMAREGYVLQNTRPFTWLCFTDRRRYLDYSRSADNFVAGQLNSYYSAQTNCVAVLTNSQSSRRQIQNGAPADGHQISASDFDALGGDTGDGSYSAMVTHELIHQLSFNTGLQTRGVEYPLWVSEGMATAFEYIFASPDVTRDNLRRLETILKLYREDRLLPLDLFVSMSRTWRTQLNDTETYAQCWALFDFLWKTRPAQLKDYLTAAARRQAGPASPSILRNEFEDCFGPVEMVESDWSAWLMLKADCAR